MNKILVTEDVEKKLQDANVKLDKDKADSQIVEEVNKSNIAVARFDESTDQIVIKQNLCG